MCSILRKFKLSEEADETRFMMRNGEYVLKEIIAASDGKYNPFRIFSAQELEIATNKYEEAFLEKQYYVLYKGFWEEQPISVMMFRNNMDNAYKNAYERCINNIVYASQMSHKHILRLIECCLDTEVPILVFESIRAVSLHDLIHGSHTPNFEPLRLTNRLKIATDIAHAVTYLHLGSPRPIIFRDIKSSNILFTEQNVAKLFDFSISKSIPKAEIHIILDDTTGVYGYFETEFVKRYYLNEKSDVYSFGVLLLELFTGQKLLDPARAENFSDSHLAHHVRKNFKGKMIFKIVDPMVVKERSCSRKKKQQQLKAFAQLMVQCLNESPQRRPTMIDVAKKLRQMYRSCM